MTILFGYFCCISLCVHTRECACTHKCLYVCWDNNVQRCLHPACLATYRVFWISICRPPGCYQYSPADLIMSGEPLKMFPLCHDFIQMQFAFRLGKDVYLLLLVGSLSMRAGFLFLDNVNNLWILVLLEQNIKGYR